MALSNEEILTAYKTLSETARKCGLGWVLEQVEERIAFGKTAVKKVKVTAARASSLDDVAELAAPQKPSAPS